RRTGQPPATLGTNGHHGTPPGCQGFSVGIRPVRQPCHGPLRAGRVGGCRRPPVGGFREFGTTRRSVGGGAAARELVDALRACSPPRALSGERLICCA